MTSPADRTRFESETPIEVFVDPHLPDVPSLMADRIASLYAAEELRERAERTERLIKQAEALDD